MISLGEISQLMSGQDLNPDDYSDSIPSEYPYVTGASSLCEEGIVLNRWTSNPKRIAKRDDILLVCKGSGVGSLGKLANVEQAHIARQIMGIRAYNNVFQPFLYYLISSIIPNLKQKATGLIPGIDRDAFLSLHCCIPALPEQFRISSLLDNIDKRIAIQNKVIDRYQSLIRAIIQQSQRNSSSRVYLREIMTERKELNTCGYDICSVSVSKGVINQVEYLGRSFAAKETSHYHVVKEGDIVYTKSPTGAFPFGIIKQSNIKKTVAVSPLYGVYEPKSLEIGTYLHYLFCSPQNVQNYLRKLIQKGAKNTINITNQHFLDNQVCLPGPKDLSRIVFTINSLAKRIEIEEFYLCQILIQKEYLLQQLFI